MFHDLINTKKTAVSNAVLRSKMKPAEKALYAVLSLISNPYNKTTYHTLKTFLKERRTATESKLAALRRSMNELPQSEKKSFTLVPEAVLLSPALSLSAKGIYMMIRSFATFKGFVIKKDYFMKKSEMGADSFNTAWKELLDCQLLCKQQNRTASGQFIYTYQLSDLQNTGCAAEEPAEELDAPMEATESAEKQQLSKVINLTAAKVTAYSEQQRKVSAISPARPASYRYQTLNNRGNFEQRTYDDDFFNHMYSDFLSSTAP